MRRVLVGALTVAVLVVLGSAPAGAHAVMRGSEPADRQVLAVGPKELVLHFSESVTLSDDSVRVLDSRGQVLVHKGADHPDGDGGAVMLPLPKLANGAYAATWRVISADSHPSAGTITFHVGEGGTGGHGHHMAAALLAPPSGNRLTGLLYGFARFSVYASLIVLVGGIAFLTLLWPAGLHKRRPAAVLRWAWLASVGATAVAVLVQQPYARGKGLATIASSSAIADDFSAHYGRVGLVRLALLVFLWAVVVRRLRDHPRGKPLGPRLRNLAVLASFAVLVTLAAVGHAVSGRMVPLGAAADMLHLMAVSLWLGGLVMLVVLLLEKPEATELAGVAPRFSAVAFGAVVTIVVTGTFQSWRQLDGIGHLTTTTYGRLLLTKVVLVSGLVALGGLSRRSLRAHFHRVPVEVAVPVSVGPGAATLNPEAELATHLRRSVGAEILVGVVVLSVTALLVNSPPGRSAAESPATTTPFRTELVQGDLKVVVTVEPALSSLNDVDISTFGPAGARTDPVEVTATLSQPAAGVQDLKVPLGKRGKGNYTSFGFQFPFPGTWKLEVVARLTDFDALRFSTDVPIR